MTQKKQKVTVCVIFFKKLRLSETPPRWLHLNPTLRLSPCMGLIALRACCLSEAAQGKLFIDSQGICRNSQIVTMVETMCTSPLQVNETH